MNGYQIEISHGAQAGTRDAQWCPGEWGATLAQAREAMADFFGAHLDKEDRGEDYENEWRKLIEQTKTAEVGDVLAFDEVAARIIKED